MDSDDLIITVMVVFVWCIVAGAVDRAFGLGWALAFFFSPVWLFPMAKTILKDFWRDAKKLLRREGDGSEIWVPIVAICGAASVYLLMS